MRCAIVVSVLLLAPGCVKRTIKISSEPSGALVWLNDREVGRTPVDVEFLHYGTYDVRLVKEGYESMLTSGEAKAPLWDVIGPDLVAELIPAEFESRVEWHYELQPLPLDAASLRVDLVDRARQLRSQAVAPDEAEASDASETPASPPSGD